MVRWAGAMLGVAIGMALPFAASAQTKSLTDLLALSGPDREAILVEGAKQEGSLSLYTSQPADDLRVFAEAFQNRYGVKFNTWRGGSEEVIQRALNEARAGRNVADMVGTNGTDLTALVRENLLEELKSPKFADLIPGAIPSHRKWMTMELVPFLQAYNTDLIKKESLPARWDDLLQPQWKGKINVEYDDADWFSEIATILGEQKGLKLFGEIAATNGITARKGHSLLNNMVASGEAPLALTSYLTSIAQLAKQDAPVDWFVIEPLVVRQAGLGAMKSAPHPYATALYVDFMATEGQEIFLSRGGVPVSSTLDSPIKGIAIRMIDTDASSDRLTKWQDAWHRLLVKPK